MGCVDCYLHIRVYKTKSEVPQGPFLGLFSLVQIIKNNKMSYHVYVDDMKIYLLSGELRLN